MCVCVCAGGASQSAVGTEALASWHGLPSGHRGSHSHSLVPASLHLQPHRDGGCELTFYFCHREQVL